MTNMLLTLLFLLALAKFDQKAKLQNSRLLETDFGETALATLVRKANPQTLRLMETEVGQKDAEKSVGLFGDSDDKKKNKFKKKDKKSKKDSLSASESEESKPSIFVDSGKADSETKVGFGNAKWTYYNPGAMFERIGKLYEPVEDNGGCHANLIPYEGYCYGTMDYKTESPSLKTQGRDQSGRFMSVPADCEIAPPDSAVVKNVVMLNPFGTKLVIFFDGSGFGTSMSTGMKGFGPGLNYKGNPGLSSLIQKRGNKWATAIGHAKVFMRCKSAKAKVDSSGIPRFERPQEKGKPLTLYCGVNKCKEYGNCHTAVDNLEEDKDFTDLKQCPKGYSMMGSPNDERNYCRDPGTVRLVDLTIIPDWLVRDQYLRVCLRSGAEKSVGDGDDSNSASDSQESESSEFVDSAKDASMQTFSMVSQNFASYSDLILYAFAAIGLFALVRIAYIVIFQKPNYQQIPNEKTEIFSASS